ncbi:MAG: antagonist of [Chitinophagaceae bacterium]|nr:MAG: antagonist of [Chitinophagaceae bacterium]
MSIRILKPGLLTTLQDAGRMGFQHLGVNPGGAMDLRAMQTANALVLNGLDEAVIEFYFPAPVIQFKAASFIALSGADFSATANGTPIPINHPIYLPANTVLQFNRKIQGQIGYLAVQGGFDLSDWLNSYSTNLKVAAGGFEGRTLLTGDEIDLKRHAKWNGSGIESAVMPWKAATESFYTTNPFRFIPGNEFDLLSEHAKKIFTTEGFTIQPQSDRMGYRLHGPTLDVAISTEMISTAVTRGTIQRLPSGQCIVLMADHQTTGGYPRIGHIISADLPGLAQKGSAEVLHFTPTDLFTAENLWVAQEQHLQQLKNACILQLDAYHRH